MVAFTANFRLAKPDFNSEGWDTTQNTNWDMVDSILGQFSTGLTIQGVWLNSTLYAAGVAVIDGLTGHVWQLSTTYTTSASPTTFAQDRATFAGFWTDITNPAIGAAASAANALISSNSATASAATATTQAAAAAASAATTAAAVSVENIRALAAEAILTTAVSTEATTRGTADTLLAAQSTVNVGRNLFHNGEFLVQQRGTGAFTANGAYSADRWTQTIAGNSLISTSIIAMVDAERTIVGDEAALWELRVAATLGVVNAADLCYLEQRMEGTQRYGGKNLTISFWAGSGVAGMKVGVGLTQNFGSGGSPSATTNVNATPVSLTTGLAKYSVTIAVPTTIGKTIGTTVGSDYTAIRFYLASGTTNNTLAGGIGDQATHTTTFWGMQCEIGSVATPLEKLSFTAQIAQCFRFFYAINATVGGPTTSTVPSSITFPTLMRAVPSVAGGGAGYITGVLNALNIAHLQTTTAVQALTFSADL